ncbi:CAP domain-containing protein [Senegalia massiliensis]|uniref:CAP domain-containing protein n=1 Tax=Senegalia massiliensis TaxID=1720316 RepID=UPI001F5ED0F9|nr:CAP domain-containing protein [Senegalia massiliensis]
MFKKIFSFFIIFIILISLITISSAQNLDSLNNTMYDTVVKKIEIFTGKVLKEYSTNNNDKIQLDFEHINTSSKNNNIKKFYELKNTNEDDKDSNLISIKKNNGQANEKVNLDTKVNIDSKNKIKSNSINNDEPKKEIKAKEDIKPEIKTKSNEKSNIEVKPKPNTETKNKNESPPKVESNTSTNTQPKPSVPTSSSRQFELEVIKLVNIERQKVGLVNVTESKSLTNVARYKSKDMITYNYFSHQSPTYGSPFNMIKKFGITYKHAGENLAAGQPTPESVVNSWMNSPSHKKNILSNNFTKIGIGYIKDDNGYPFWTQMFIG